MRLITTLTAVLACAVPAAAAAATDGLRAMNVVPPGQSGNTTLAEFAGAQSTGNYGPNTDNQESLYANWQYKPFQFQNSGPATSPPGDPRVTIWRDPGYGVPTITGRTDADAFYGVGYAMAQDRLFQMEVFRHVGHGTLASLIGAAGLSMDEATRRYTEGDAALRNEFGRLPPDAQMRVTEFVAGINAYIDQVQGNALTMPAEFTLLSDLPIRHWTVADVLGFGEYAGRFFGEFGHGELGAAAIFERLVARFGLRRAEMLFNDALPLNDPRAPASIARQDGIFPRHVGRPVKTAFTGSPYANHQPGLLPPLRSLDHTAAVVDVGLSRVHELQRILAIPRMGSNAAIVSARMTRDHKPMLYGGPQTGWAVPGFFWEVELHSPARDERGVMVPAVPLIVIGRNATAAWTVTSALDANADTFVEQLDRSNSSYVHDRRRLKVTKQVEVIPCQNPPTSATPLLGGRAPKLCPSTPDSITVWRTVHGPSIANPDSGHHLFVRDSVVDGRLLASLTAWDLAGRQTNARSFAGALKDMSLGFNFFYVDDHGTIAYWHTGRYPIRPRNADPRLPMPGDGRYDWQGFEPWNAHPHAINPKAGFVVNWNNKPSVGWYSKNLELDSEGGVWGDQWESVPLAAVVRRGAPFTFQSFGQVPRAVAYIDNRARVLLPYLRAALKHTHDPQLRAIRPYVDAWNGHRDVISAKRYATPAVVFFDRFVEMLLRDVERPILGRYWAAISGLSCETCHLVSVDNLGAPTYKFDYPGLQLLAAALNGHTGYRWIANPTKLLLRAAGDAAAELTASQGAAPAKWNEPAESATFSAQGGISVPDITPLPNRGSYGQVVEAIGAP